MNEKAILELFDKMIEYSKKRDFNITVDFSGIDYNQRTGVMTIAKITCHSVSEPTFEFKHASAPFPVENNEIKTTKK